MLTRNEEDFLKKIPAEKLVVIKPFNPMVTKVASEIISEIHQVVPGLEVKHLGASALQISGQNDIDIYIFCEPKKFGEYETQLVNKFGEPNSKKYDSVAWELRREGLEVEMYLTDPTSKPMKRQMKIFSKLENSKDLTEKYERLKNSLSGKSFRDYQLAKYEFYHQILGE